MEAALLPMLSAMFGNMADDPLGLELPQLAIAAITSVLGIALYLEYLYSHTDVPASWPLSATL